MGRVEGKVAIVTGAASGLGELLVLQQTSASAPLERRAAG